MEEETCLIQSNKNVKLVKFDRQPNRETTIERKPREPKINKDNEREDKVTSGKKENTTESVVVKKEIFEPVPDDRENTIDIRVEEEGQLDNDEEVKERERMMGEGETSKEETVKRDNSNAVPTKIPPDGGWGWLVLAGSFVVMLLISSIGPCFSMVFSPILLDLGTPPSTVFWIFSTFSLIWNLISPAVGPLTKEFGHRRVAMVGAGLVTFGLVVSAFATSSWILFVFFSFLGGIGAGILVTISNLIIPVYFTKRLGRANGILMTGTSIGLFTAPHLITFLQDRYTYFGATLILGGIFLNTCISAAVFQPVEWHSKQSVCPVDSVSKREFQIQQGGSDNARNSAINRRHPSVTVPKAAPTDHNRKSVGICTLLSRVCCSTLLSLKILCSPPAFIIALSGTLTMSVYLNFLIMVPFVVKNLYSHQASAMCLSVAGICNLVSRLVMSAMTDCRWFDKRIGYIVSISIVAFTNIVFPFLRSFLWMTVVMGIWGYGIGSFMGLYNLVMIEYMGAKNLPAMFGSASLLNGIGFITIGPLLGFVTEITGSYSVSIWTLASIECFCIILWLLMPAAVSCQARNQPHSHIPNV